MEEARLKVKSPVFPSSFLIHRTRVHQIDVFTFHHPRENLQKQLCCKSFQCVNFAFGYSFSTVNFPNPPSVLVKWSVCLGSFGWNSGSLLNSVLRPTLDRDEGFITFQLVNLGILLTSSYFPASQSNKVTRKKKSQYV